VYGRNAEELGARLRQAAWREADGARMMIGGRALQEIAEELDLSLREVECAALRHSVIPARYRRNLGTWSADAQLRLLGGCALVAGLGGLGGLAAELLARAGVGRLILVDPDVFEEGNLNRQLLASERTLGTSKVVAAADRIRSVNAAVEVVRVAGPVQELPEELLAQAGVVLDCLDNFPSRYRLQARCRQVAVPLVFAAVGGLVAQVTTVLPGERGVELLYGPEPPGGPGAEAALGTPPATPAAAAAWQVQEAISVLLGRPPALRNRVLCLDLEAGRCDVFALDE